MQYEKDIKILGSVLNKISILFNKQAKKIQLKEYQLLVYYTLYTNTRLTQQQISEGCHLPKQTVQKAIRDLAALHCVTMKTDASDKRKKIITLTAPGKRYIEAALRPALEMDQQIINRMGQKEYNTLIDSLITYCWAFEEASLTKED